MSRKHRHYRKHKSTAEAVKTLSTTVTHVDTSLPFVQEDLKRTAAIFGLLLAAMILLSVLNTQQHWTLNLGSQLYNLLHIR